jgi:hypothetical protein
MRQVQVELRASHVPPSAGSLPSIRRRDPDGTPAKQPGRIRRLRRVVGQFGSRRLRKVSTMALSDSKRNTPMNAAVNPTMRPVRWLGTSRTATMQASGKPKPDPNETHHRRRDCGVASAQSRRAILHLPRQSVVCHSDCSVRTLKGYASIEQARHLLQGPEVVGHASGHRRSCATTSPSS